MKLFKIIVLVVIALFIVTNNLDGQMLSLKYNSIYTVEIPCTGERVKGTIYFHNVSKVGELPGYSKYISNIHSSELVSDDNNNVYRLAGCTEERVIAGNTSSYLGVWHFVGKKGNQIRITVTSPPTPIGDFGIPESLSFLVDCE